MNSPNRLPKVVAVVFFVFTLLVVPFGAVGLGSGVEGPGESNDVTLQNSSDVDIDEAVRNETGEFETVVWTSDRGNFANFADKSEAITIEKEFWLIDAFLVSVNADQMQIEQMATIEGVQEIHANFEVQAESTALHPGTHTASDFKSTIDSTETTYGLEQINAPRAWEEYETRGEATRVAVLDTGIDADHVDLELYTDDPNDPTYPGGWAEISSSGNVVDGSKPHDTDDHGTHVSGTVAGGNESGEHIGVAPDAQLMHGLVVPDGSGSFSQIIGGMEWALENDADVISMSFGVDGYESVFIDPINAAEDEGVVVVASIGNSGEGTSSSPGNEYDSIGVGASHSDESIRAFSGGELIDTSEAWGSSAPDHWPDEYIVPSIAAPGSFVRSAVPGNGYTSKSGTSMAAPHVAGAIALIQSATDEHHSPDEIKEALRETAWKADDWDEQDAEDSLDGADTRYGYGIIDAYAAIEYLKADQPDFEVSDVELTEDTILEGETAEVTATVENVGDEEGEFDAEFRVTDEDGATELLDTTTVTLAPGEYTTVTLPGTVSEAGTYQADVSGTSTPNELTVERPATFELSDGSLSDDTITEGESVEVSATVENIGDREGTFNAELEVDGHVEATTDVTLAGGAADTVAFDYEPPEAGEYELAIAGDDGDGDRIETHVGTLEVLEPAEFEVRDPTLAETEILEGESVEVTATVENVGDVEDTFTAELEVEHEVGSVEVRATEDVTLAGGESTMVSFDETFESAGAYEILVSGEHAGTLTVEELAPAEFETSDVTLGENPILEGDSVDIEATVENVGDESGEHTATLYVDGEERATETVELEGGASTIVVFTEQFDEADDYEVTVDDAPAVTLTVEQPATFEIDDASVSPTELETGESATVEGTVTNVGDRAGEHTVELAVDGEVVATETVELNAGASTDVSFTHTFEEAGDYAIALDNSHVDEVSVVDPAAFEVTADVPGETFEPGETVAVDVTVENVGGETSTNTVEFAIDDETPETHEVELAPGESETVTFERTFEEAGAYTVVVDGVDRGTIEVVDPDPAEPEITDAELEETTITTEETATVEAIVENVGDESGSFTVVLNADGDAVDETDVSLAGGETTSVEFTFDPTEAGTYELVVESEDSTAEAGTLTVEEPATFEVSDASLDETTITEGESVEVSADVENVGDRDGTFTAELVVDDVVVATQDVHVEAGNTETATFVESFTEPGEYEIDVNDVHAGTLTVEEEPEADLEVTGADLGSSTITEGESVEVTATVENTGDAEGSMTVYLVVDGIVEDSTEVTVPGNDATTVTFTYEPSDAGEYEIDVNDVHAGTLTVEEEPEAVFEVTGTTLSDETIEAGEVVDITATVENVGDAEGSHEVELVVDGETVETVTVSLDTGESTTVQFSRTFDDAGEYAIAVDDAYAGTLEVLKPADVEVTDAYLDAEAIEEGESVTATVELTNAGDVDGEITVTVDFGDGASVDRTVTVAGGETVTETVEHTYDAAGEYEVTADGVAAGTVAVTEPSPAELEVIDATLDSETILEGETAVVESTVENVGDETGELVVELQLDDAVYDSTKVTLAPGEPETVVLEATVADAGEYDVSVNGVDVGTLTVKAPADLEVVDASLADDEITVGESVEVTGEVANTGDVAGTLPVDLEIDGEVVATTEVEVAPGEVESVTFEWTVDEEGDVPVSLNGVYAGTVVVAEEDSADDGDDADDGDSGGGSGGGAGGGGAGGGGAGGAAPPPADDPEDEDDTETEPELTTVEANDEGASILVNDTASGGTVSLDVRDAVANGSVAGGYLALDGLTIDVGDGAGAFELDVARLTAEPRKGSDLLNHEEGYLGLAYVSVETDVDNADLDEVRFEFSVPSAALPEGASPADVMIVRHDGEAWQTLETEHEGGDTYSAVSPGFSEFAVAVPASVGAEGDEDAAAFEILDIDVSESSVVEGEETTVTALVENVGNGVGTVTIELTVDGEARAIRDVTLDPDESVEVEFAPTFEAPGTYEVSVSGIDESVTVTVERADSSETTSADPDDDSGSGIDDREFPMGLLAAGGLVALVLLVGGVAVVARGGVGMESVADGSTTETADTELPDGAGSEAGFSSGTHSRQSRSTEGHGLPDESQSEDGGFQWVGDD